jgi:cytochrome b
MPDASTHRVKVWDLPTRLYHWVLAVAAVAMLVTGRIGGEVMVWHARLGYCVGALILFRLLWGWAGGHWSRFTSFPPSPRAAWKYLRASAAATPLAGHSPLGALSVYAMLAFLLLQVASGLFSETKEDFAGPLTALVSNATVHWFTGYHKNVGQWVLIGLVVLHLAAIAWYDLRGEKLLGAMLHGEKVIAAAGTPSRDDASSRFRALALLVLCGLVMWGVVSLGG